MERNLLVMADRMRRAGHHVSMGAVEGTPTWEEATLKKLSPHSVPHHPRRATVSDVRRMRQRMEGADVVWIRAPRDLDLVSRACRHSPTKLLMQQAMQIGRPKTFFWHQRRYRSVDAWVCGLHALEERTLALTPLVGHQTHVIPLPLEDVWFDTPHRAKEDARKDLGLDLPAGTPLVGTVGRLDQGKGQRLTLEALLALPDHVHALFVGDNTVNNGRDEHSQLRLKAKALGVEDRVHWLGAMKDVLPVYDALDVFAMTSHAETIGTVTLEAMARGVPVVGSAAGGTKELLDEGRGQTFPSSDAAALASVIRATLGLSDTERRQQLDLAFALAMKSSHSEQSAIWERLLQSVVGSGEKA